MMQQDTFCNITIDYTHLAGDTLLPFQVALDLEHSDLLPEPGQAQRFCYTVTGVGAHLPQAGDLRHLVLGISSHIAAQDLKSVFVSVDGAEQAVVPGETIRLVNPDPLTGCCGIKFSFPLARAGGVMRFCFELSAPCSVAPVPVSLFGEGTSVSGLSICGPAMAAEERLS